MSLPAQHFPVLGLVLGCLAGATLFTSILVLVPVYELLFVDPFAWTEMDPRMAYIGLPIILLFSLPPVLAVEFVAAKLGARKLTNREAFAVALSYWGMPFALTGNALPIVIAVFVNPISFRFACAKGWFEAKILGR